MENQNNLLSGLNEEQKEAVFHYEGPLLILAGAGSGKTRVLTYRMAYLVNEKNVHPASILAITFTNKAAKEMKNRIESLIGAVSEGIWVSTFHSACVRILRRYIDKVGYDKSFNIYDYSDQQTLVKECLKQLNINEKNYPPKSVLEMIGKAKDELIEPKTYMKLNQDNFRLKQIAEVYELYQKKLKENNALDFDDIIMNTIKIFIENDDVLDYYQKKFKFIMVDEYQDTNTAQYTLISLLSQVHKNLCVVGDDDQSIYGWRGANIRNILDFEKEFRNCKVIKLEQNYRSTKIILDAANCVIANNEGRKSKELWTHNSQGEKIKWYQASNGYDEGMFVAREIKRSMDFNQDLQYKDFAVLFRINAQSRVLEEMLIKEGIPYKIVGGLRFYDRREIKDVLAYLRVIQNPADNISLKRIINVPKRGIGNTTVEGAENIAYNRECSLFSIISSASEVKELNRASAKLINFVSMINNLRAIKDDVSVTALIEKLLAVSGIIKELEEENTVESKTRIENIKELLSVALEFEKQNEDQGLNEFLCSVSLISDIDNVEEELNSILLMTLHSAKGLEFSNVFMVGLEEGVFPGFRSMNEQTELEEERRLCYVGITRAKEKLYITNAESRTLFGNTSYNRISRFFREIPNRYIEPYTESKNLNSGSNSNRESQYTKNNFTNRVGNIGSLDSSHKNKSTNTTGADMKTMLNDVFTVPVFTIGDVVEHKKFGTGVIMLVENENEDFKLEIAFENLGMKRLMANYANLIKVG